MRDHMTGAGFILPARGRHHARRRRVLVLAAAAVTGAVLGCLMLMATWLLGLAGMWPSW